MADPLSTIASLVAILQLAGTVVTYLNDVKEASNDRNRILLELSSTTGLLFSLKDLVERPCSDDAWDTALYRLGGPNGPLEQFRSALERLATKLAPVMGIRTVGNALGWPFLKKDVEETLKTIERLKSLTALALQRDYMSVDDSLCTVLASHSNVLPQSFIRINSRRCPRSRQRRKGSTEPRRNQGTARPNRMAFSIELLVKAERCFQQKARPDWRMVP